MWDLPQSIKLKNAGWSGAYNLTLLVELLRALAPLWKPHDGHHLGPEAGAAFFNSSSVRPGAARALLQAVHGATDAWAAYHVAARCHTHPPGARHVHWTAEHRGPTRGLYSGGLGLLSEERAKREVRQWLYNHTPEFNLRRLLVQIPALSCCSPAFTLASDKVTGDHSFAHDCTDNGKRQNDCATSELSFSQFYTNEQERSKATNPNKWLEQLLGPINGNQLIPIYCLTLKNGRKTYNHLILWYMICH